MPRKCNGHSVKRALSLMHRDVTKNSIVTRGDRKKLEGWVGARGTRSGT